MRIAIVLLLVSLSAGRVPAQSGDSARLEPIRQLRKGVDAWPLIAHASTPAERSVNAILNRLNERMTKALSDCDENYRERVKQVAQPLMGNNAQEGDWERKITVTMAGPHYLALVAIDSIVFCGGAHPDSYTLAMVFDLTTGSPVIWMNLIAASANASAYSHTTYDGTTVGALIVPALRAMTIAQAVEDCKSAFLTPQPYQLWPDAKSGTLTAEPIDLPHVVAACADDLKLTPNQARALGFDNALLSAIAQAHRQIVAGRH
ncbi:MAG: hypothetical protein WA294_14480 [Acidobacteriaceae bacterium]